MKTPQFCAIIPTATTTISLREGMLLQAGGVPLVLRKIDSTGVLLQHQTSGECKLTTEAKLLDAILAGEVHTEQSRRDVVHGIDQKAIEIASARGVSHRQIEVWSDKMAWIQALKTKGVTQITEEPWIRAAMDQIGREELVGRRRFTLGTLYKTDLKIRNAEGDITAAIPKYDSRGGRGQNRIDPRTLDFITTEIQRVKSDPAERVIKKAIFQSITAIIDHHNADKTLDPVPMPGATTVAREINKQISEYEIARRNYGKRSANSQYRQNANARDTAIWPLEVAEYDDIDSGVFAVDERNGLPWGRIYITNGISQQALMVLGYDLGDMPRSFESAIGAICDTLLPKADCLPGEMGYGNPGQILLDNASYNESVAMMEQSKGLKLLLSAARPYGPTEKSSIEHFNHIIKSDFCPTLPGWSGPKGDREAVDEGISSAAITLDTFRKMYRHWVTKIYANSPGMDGKTPKQRWLAHYGRHSPSVRYTKEQLALFRLRPITLKFRDSGGLRNLELRYSNDELEALQRRMGAKAKVLVFSDFMDLSYLIVPDPYTGSIFRVPCTEDPQYVKSLTHRQQKTLLAIARANGKKNPSIPELWEARKELIRMVKEAMRSNRIRRRTWGRRNEDKAKSEDLVPAIQMEPKKEKLVTELEYQIEQILLMSLEDEVQE